jgi:transposase-like protein
MSVPDGCPFCRSFDVRPISDVTMDLIGYRCHDCTRTFYVTAAEGTPSPQKMMDTRAPVRNRPAKTN